MNQKIQYINLIKKINIIIYFKIKMNFYFIKKSKEKKNLKKNQFNK